MLPVPTDADAFARHLAAAYAAETKSIVTFVAVTTFEGHGGPFSTHRFSETAYEESAGEPVRKRLLRAVEDGKTLDSYELTKRSAAVDPPTSRFGMHTPLVAASSDYTYSNVRSDGDIVSVDFTATVRDAAHGDGTLTVLRSEERVATIVIRPAVLPEHATSLTMTFEYGKVSEDRWDVVKITSTFAGRQGFISGRGSSVTTYERYRPYASESAADAALTTMLPASG